MIIGDWQTIVMNVSVSNVETAEIDLGRPWEVGMLVVPLINTAQISFKVAKKTGGTFQALHGTDPVNGDSHQILSTAGAGAMTWTFPLLGFQFIKVVTTNGQDANRSFDVCGIRS